MAFPAGTTRRTICAATAATFDIVRTRRAAQMARAEKGWSSEAAYRAPSGGSRWRSLQESVRGTAGGLGDELSETKRVSLSRPGSDDTGERVLCSAGV